MQVEDPVNNGTLCLEPL